MANYINPLKNSLDQDILFLLSIGVVVLSTYLNKSISKYEIKIKEMYNIIYIILKLIHEHGPPVRRAACRLVFIQYVPILFMYY